MKSTLNFSLFKRDDLHSILAALRTPGGAPILLVLPMEDGGRYAVNLYPTDACIEPSIVSGMHNVTIKASQLFDDPAPRKTGQTSRQMRAAPQWATFVCPSDAKFYYADLAVRLGRGDLTIVPLYWLDRAFPRTTGRALVIDHAARLNERQAQVVRMWVTK